jgi:hypothetical protein
MLQGRAAPGALDAFARPGFVPRQGAPWIRPQFAPDPEAPPGQWARHPQNAQTRPGRHPVGPFMNAASRSSTGPGAGRACSPACPPACRLFPESGHGPGMQATPGEEANGAEYKIIQDEHPFRGPASRTMCPGLPPGSGFRVRLCLYGPFRPGSARAARSPLPAGLGQGHARFAPPDGRFPPWNAFGRVLPAGGVTAGRPRPEVPDARTGCQPRLGRCATSRPEPGLKRRAAASRGPAGFRADGWRPPPPAPAASRWFCVPSARPRWMHRAEAARGPASAAKAEDTTVSPSTAGVCGAASPRAGPQFWRLPSTARASASFGPPSRPGRQPRRPPGPERGTALPARPPAPCPRLADEHAQAKSARPSRPAPATRLPERRNNPLPAQRKRPLAGPWRRRLPPGVGGGWPCGAGIR